jgi:hypothetical protein
MKPKNVNNTKLSSYISVNDFRILIVIKNMNIERKYKKFEYIYV